LPTNWFTWEKSLAHCQRANSELFLNIAKKREVRWCKILWTRRMR
jgi:hypothetical protein